MAAKLKAWAPVTHCLCCIPEVHTQVQSMKAFQTKRKCCVWPHLDRTPQIRNIWLQKRFAPQQHQQAIHLLLRIPACLAQHVTHGNIVWLQDLQIRQVKADRLLMLTATAQQRLAIIFCNCRKAAFKRRMWCSKCICIATELAISRMKNRCQELTCHLRL